MIAAESEFRHQRSASETGNVCARFGAVLFGAHHGPHVARTEVISLTIFDGPLTVT